MKPLGSKPGLTQIPSAYRDRETQARLYRQYRYGYGYGQVRAESATNARLRERSRERRKLVRESRAAERKVASEPVMPEWE